MARSGYEVMTSWLARQDRPGREAANRRICAELDALFDLALPGLVDHDPAWPALCEEIAGQVVVATRLPTYPFDAELSLQLIEALASDRQGGVPALINDLAEIVFLPREQRREYLYHNLASPPFVIRKLLLEYATKARQLDDLTGVLTKGSCATECDRLPTGCCSVLGYDMGVVPQTMLDLQCLEARRAGWIEPQREDECKLHTRTGCVISLFKSPACIGFLCEPLVAALCSRYPAPAVIAFAECLAVFRNCDLGRRRIFEAMDAAIEAGRVLTERPRA